MVCNVELLLLAHSSEQFSAFHLLHVALQNMWDIFQVSSVFWKC